MRVIHDPKELPQHGCNFVPTMGALHEGHCELIKCANQNCGDVIVSIFVNPTQFAPNEDFSAYPRTFDKDVELAKSSGANIVFAPTVEVVYEKEMEDIPLPTVATEPKLEDAIRPTHFQGVCNVVARLFDFTNPAKAFFGEKDYQQLKVIESMTRQDNRWSSLEIVAVPTARDIDGVALSSRNAYLSQEEREQARAISRSLTVGCENGMKVILEEAGLDVDYAVIRDAYSLLAPVEGRPRRAIVAARAGSTRLIDNGALP